MFPIFVGKQDEGGKEVNIIFLSPYTCSNHTITKTIFFKSTNVSNKSQNLNKVLPSKVVFQAIFLNYLFEE